MGPLAEQHHKSLMGANQYRQAQPERGSARLRRTRLLNESQRINNINNNYYYYYYYYSTSMKL